MKERPILFSGPMVKAILNGTKTQTRRIVKHEFVSNRTEQIIICEDESWLQLDNGGGNNIGYCPYGTVGDTLWCRETHRVLAGNCHYRASLPEGSLDCHFKPWKPSIFMRREHSRITLEITKVRIERLQNISEADAIEEGIKVNAQGELASATLQLLKGEQWPAAVLQYAYLWNSINGPDAWDANPFVWVIEFRRVEP
jgi:hypothetical protein